MLTVLLVAITLLHVGAKEEPKKNELDLPVSGEIMNLSNIDNVYYFGNIREKNWN